MAEALVALLPAGLVERIGSIGWEEACREVESALGENARFLEIVESLTSPSHGNGKDEVAANEVREAGNKAFRATNLQDATNLYTRALSLSPEGSDSVPKAYANRAACLEEMGPDVLPWAIADCTRAIEADAGYGKAWLRRGLLRARAGDRDGGLEDLKEAARLEGDGAGAANLQKELKRVRKMPLGAKHPPPPLHGPEPPEELVGVGASP